MHFLFLNDGRTKASSSTNIGNIDRQTSFRAVRRLDNSRRKCRGNGEGLIKKYLQGSKIKTGDRKAPVRSCQVCHSSVPVLCLSFFRACFYPTFFFLFFSLHFLLFRVPHRPTALVVWGVRAPRRSKWSKVSPSRAGAPSYHGGRDSAAVPQLPKNITNERAPGIRRQVAISRADTIVLGDNGADDYISCAASRPSYIIPVTHGAIPRGRAPARTPPHACGDEATQTRWNISRAKLIRAIKLMKLIKTLSGFFFTSVLALIFSLLCPPEDVSAENKYRINFVAYQIIFVPRESHLILKCAALSVESSRSITPPNRP
ncbi:hypothetical protein PUN28_005756 [Cardiocondyla obscurior]|uniref:Uncharacterized protein n=1 Tax=Cardiocondyla obscurior TaxID=286306 RepID=A0AAW2G926_9HYME